jgi:hypothetical protein
VSAKKDVNVGVVPFSNLEVPDNVHVPPVGLMVPALFVKSPLINRLPVPTTLPVTITLFSVFTPAPEIVVVPSNVVSAVDV